MTLAQLLGRAGLSAGSHLVTRGAFLLAFILFARSLTVTEFAELAYFNLTLTTVASLATLGASSAAVRAFAQEAQGVADGREQLNALIVFSVVVGSAVSLAFWLLLPTPPLAGAGSWLFAIFLLFVIFDVVPASALNGRENYARMLVNAVVAAVVFLGLAVWAYHLASLVWAVAALGAAYGVKWIVDAAFLKGDVRLFRRPSSAAMKKMTAIMGVMAIASTLYALGIWGLGTRVKDVLGDGQFALWSICMQWYAIAVFAAANVTRILLPQQVRHADDAQKARALMRKGALLAIGTSLATALGIWLLSDLLAGFYGPKYDGLATLLPLFAFAAIPVATLNMVRNRLLSEDREKYWALSTLAWAAVLIVWMFAFIDQGIVMLLGGLVAANVVLGAVSLSLARLPR